MTKLIDVARTPGLFARAIVAGIALGWAATHPDAGDDDVTIIRGPECEVVE